MGELDLPPVPGAFTPPKVGDLITVIDVEGQLQLRAIATDVQPSGLHGWTISLISDPLPDVELDGPGAGELEGR